MDTADKIAVIFKEGLRVEEPSTRSLMDEILVLCQSPEGTAQAAEELEARRKEFSHNIDFLDKVPYVCLFLAYARFKQNELTDTLKWIKFAIDRLDQLDQVWNRSIARWMCALIYQQSNRPDNARMFFEAAIKLMKQEIQDLRRKSLHDKADACELTLDHLRKDAGLLPENIHVRLPVPSPSDRTVADLTQQLLDRVNRDHERAKELIALERINAPHLSREELIRRAIENLGTNNQQGNT